VVFTLVIGFVPDSGLKAILGHTSSQAASSSKSRENLGTSLVELVENQSENHLRFRLENHLQLTRDDFFSCHFFLVSGRTFASQRPGGTQVGTSRPGPAAQRLFWDDLGG